MAPNPKSLEAEPSTKRKRALTGSHEQGSAKPRRSERTTKGEGGRIAQLESLHDAIRPELGKTVNLGEQDSSIPATNLNPMAPGRKRTRKSEKRRSPKTAPPAIPPSAPTGQPTPPLHIVPPGSEPSLRPPETTLKPPAPPLRHLEPTFQIAASGSRFGFRPTTVLPQDGPQQDPPNTNPSDRPHQQAYPPDRSHRQAFDPAPNPPNQPHQSAIDLNLLPGPIPSHQTAPRPHQSAFNPTSNPSDRPHQQAFGPTPNLPGPSRPHHSVIDPNLLPGPVPSHQTAPFADWGGSSHSRDTDPTWPSRTDTGRLHTDDTSSEDDASSLSSSDGGDYPKGGREGRWVEQGEPGRQGYHPDPLLEPGFDISNDEDKRNALENLHGEGMSTGQECQPTNEKRKGKGKDPKARQQSSDSLNSSTFDVLNDHHKRNCAPRPPDPKRLDEVCRALSKLGMKSNTGSAGSQESISSEDDNNSETANSTRRATRHSKTPFGSRPPKTDQLQFYPSQWRDVLELAKWKYRAWMMSECPFPDRGVNFSDAADCLTEAIVEHEEGGGTVEDGYYPQYKKAMTKLIWQDGSSFRGDLKKLARIIVPESYKFFPDSKEKLSRRAYIAHIKQEISKLLRGAFFLQGGVDNEGRTDNFAHPALKDLCKTFFYGSDSCIGSRFPDLFEKALPHPALCLAATAINCALDEWKDGKLCKLSFTRKEYFRIYRTMEKLMVKIETNPYHSAKLLELREILAHGGMIQSGAAQDSDEDIELGYDILLD